MGGVRPIIVKGMQALGINRVAHALYYRYIHGFRSAQREVVPALERCLEIARDLGTAEHYCEFGLFKGHTFWRAQKAANSLGLEKMRFFGFDSFSGLPEIGEEDRTENDEFYEGQYSCSKESVLKNLCSKDVDWQRTFLIEGYFDQTLNDETKSTHDLRGLCIGLIDCDLYASTVDVLAFIDDLLIDGSILMFDDWNCFDQSEERGQRRAFREFLDGHPEIKPNPLFSYGTYGQVFKMEKNRLS